MEGQFRRENCRLSLDETPPYFGLVMDWTSDLLIAWLHCLKGCCVCPLSHSNDNNCGLLEREDWKGNYDRKLNGWLNKIGYRWSDVSHFSIINGFCNVKRSKYRAKIEFKCFSLFSCGSAQLNYCTTSKQPPNISCGFRRGPTRSWPRALCLQWPHSLEVNTTLVTAIISAIHEWPIKYIHNLEVGYIPWTQFHHM